MQTTRPRGRPRLAALDQRILEATLHVLAEGGYAHMSFDDIATAAHTTRATIYLRYPSKAELTAAAIVSAQHPSALPPTRGDLRQDLIAQLRHFQESMAAPYSLPVVGMALAEASSTPELLSALREHVVAAQRRTLLSILQQAITHNELEPQIDLDLAIAQLVGSYYALSIAGECIPADWPERVVDQVLVGIRREASA